MQERKTLDSWFDNIENVCYKLRLVVLVLWQMVNLEFSCYSIKFQGFGDTIKKSKPCKVVMGVCYENGSDSFR